MLKKYLNSQEELELGEDKTMEAFGFLLNYFNIIYFPLCFKTISVQEKYNGSHTWGATYRILLIITFLQKVKFLISI